MKIVGLLLLLMISCVFVFSQSREERSELIQLVDQRQAMFDRYASSLKKKSGIFGQKTKNDLRATHDKLKAIVEVDNKIMTRLRQLLDYSKFEKQTLSYDVNQYETQLKNFERNQDTLVKQLAQLEKSNAEFKNASTKNNSWFYFLLGIGFAIAAFFIRKRIMSKT